MRRDIDRMVYDFRTDTWIRPDAFNSLSKHVAEELPPPESPPEAGRWTRPTEDEANREPFVWLGVVVVACVVGAVAFASVVPLLGVAFCAALVREIPKRRIRDDHRLTGADRRLIEDPDDLEVCLVRITVVRDGRTVGGDKGVVWFDAGRLLYNGHRTSFAVGGEDVLPLSEWHVYVNGEGTNELGDLSLPLRVDKGSAYVRLFPLTDGSLLDGKREMRFRRNLANFRKRPSRSSGPRQWPPLQ